MYAISVNQLSRVLLLDEALDKDESKVVLGLQVLYIGKEKVESF